jgi:hypothetical protein
MIKIGVPLCQVDDPHKNSYFTHGLLLAIGIIAIAGEGFVAESNVNLSDSYDFSFSSTIKLSQDSFIVQFWIRSNPHSQQVLELAICPGVIPVCRLQW